jgi:hypothetical protein
MTSEVLFPIWQGGQLTLGKEKTILEADYTPEPVFLNVYGAQESIPRNEFYVAWRAGTITLFLLGF